MPRPTRFASAAFALTAFLTGCAATTPVSTVTETLTVTPTATKTTTPKPVILEVSGSYKDDMAALGFVPDNDEEFQAYMVNQLCKQSGEALGVRVRVMGGDPQHGHKAVRLTVSYFCREKTAEVEHYLEYFK